MYKDNITLEILVNGVPVTEFQKDGNRYVEGRKNSTYTLRIKNHTWEQVLIVPSVDGVSVMDGKLAGKDSSGYVLGPNQSYDIEGWRTDLNNVRKFEFTKHSKSYAEKTEQGGNLGVIGLLCFKEEPKPIQEIHHYWHNYRWPYWYINTNGWYDNNELLKGASDTVDSDYTKGVARAYNLSCSVGAMQNAQAIPVISDTIQNSVGTGMGEKIESKVVETQFKRQSIPFTDLRIYYFERKQLEQMGVIKKEINSLPNPFPNLFCKEI